ncbi:hypothetical protein AFCDBAGC_4831 [Methylobacterium cerastii]|uniref:Uncharacterized protein n=1 Tax=Methylobacterium cerastii TaxID=932741 RepID=A0ABQ4QPF2_9HYPH|nr:hypothetical protein [Methylobacterium cerastii]GJD46946.1 hypothetical protein AFCDBAGC_4831 [Methylobacterium cerastii]
MTAKDNKLDRLERSPPTDREQRAIKRAAERYRARAEPFAYGSQAGQTNKLDWRGKHDDDAGHLLTTIDTFGTASPEFAQHNIGRVAAVMRGRGEKLPSDMALNAGLAAVSGIAPQDEVEAMLATQMVGVHEVAMEMLTRAKLADTTDALERYGALATKLLRTYTTQVEALAKLRRKGEQTVRVEHVHVYPGGQAIVGNVTQGGGAPNGNRHQPHAPERTSEKPAFSAPVGTSMRCADTGRESVPVTGGGGEEAMPDARRRPRQWRTSG